MNISYKTNAELPVVKKGWRGNVVVNGRFNNLSHRAKHGLGSVLKWRFSPNPQRKEKKLEKWNPPVHYLHTLKEMTDNSLVWLGHNSFFLQLSGKRILFDPVFGNIPFVKRKSNLPVLTADVFKHIDYLLISHDHYDHMDKKSIIQVCKNNPNITLFCGLGVGKLIKKWVGNIKIIEAGWYQQICDDKLKITFLPCQHWGKRWASDGGKRLWGAYMVQSEDLALYYSGDTGYSSHFKEVGKLFKKVDYALVGIGAYKPRWFMQPNHISPYEALDAANDMNAGVVIPMHYGTFDLADEPLSDPPAVFRSEAKKRGATIIVPHLGEVLELNKK